MTMQGLRLIEAQMSIQRLLSLPRMAEEMCFAIENGVYDTRDGYILRRNDEPIPRCED